MDAIQEVTILTSNFAPEYGQVGGGFFNYTMKSGTNQFHGSAYDYIVNEALNASAPWVNAKPVARRHDYGFTIGGPVLLGKFYNGHNKTFFFFNWEQFRENQNVNNQTVTLPVDAYRVDSRFQRRQSGITDGSTSCGQSNSRRSRNDAGERHTIRPTAISELRRRTISTARICDDGRRHADSLLRSERRAPAQAMAMEFRSPA